jgi:hypothetical protein
VPEGATSFSAMAKYAVGEDNGGYTIDQINVFLKLANADFDVEIGAAGAAASADFTEYSVDIATADTAARLQVAGQETTGWGALVSDTLWVGAVTVHTDAGDSVIFDPETYDASTLPEGVTIVAIGGDDDGPNALNSLTTQEISVYPNPAQSVLTVKGVQNIAEINVISLTGANVMTVQNSDIINVENLTEGLYLIKVQTGNETLTTTFIKQ